MLLELLDPAVHKAALHPGFRGTVGHLSPKSVWVVSLSRVVFLSHRWSTPSSLQSDLVAPGDDIEKPSTRLPSWRSSSGGGVLYPRAALEGRGSAGTTTLLTSLSTSDGVRSCSKYLHINIFIFSYNNSMKSIPLLTPGRNPVHPPPGQMSQITS